MQTPDPPRPLVLGRRWVPLVPAALLAVVFGCDAAMGVDSGGILVTGLLDEPAHLSTAALVLLAAVPAVRLVQQWRLALVAVACAVLIDLDHVPLYLGLPVAVGGRPVTHSLVTVALLLLVALIVPRGARRWPVAAAVGVCLHFVRDIATGPGLTLWVPFSARQVLLPYGLYAAVVSVAAVVGTVRLLGAVRRTRLSGPGATPRLQSSR